MGGGAHDPKKNKDGMALLSVFIGVKYAFLK